MVLVDSQIFSGVKILFVFFNLDKFVIFFICSDVLVLEKLLPWSANRGVRDFDSRPEMIVEAVYQMEKTSLTHLKDLVVS